MKRKPELKKKWIGWANIGEEGIGGTFGRYNIFKTKKIAYSRGYEFVRKVRIEIVEEK